MGRSGTPGLGLRVAFYFRHHEGLLMGNSAGPLFGGQALVAKFLDTFKEYPPSQSPASFSIDQIVAKMKHGAENLQPTGSPTGKRGEQAPPK